MLVEQLLLALGPGPLCPQCPYLRACGAAELPEACQPNWGSAASGGVNALHPHHPDAASHIAEVGGVDLDDVAVGFQPALRLQRTVHHIRPLRALRGQLDDEAYVVGLEAITRAHGLRSAREMRDLIGLSPDRKLGLILFGKDRTLERLWGRRFLLIDEIAHAGYDFGVPPSYSNYRNRPRPEFLFNLKRSFAFLDLMVRRGVPTIPRVAWNVEPDVYRIAVWVDKNPLVHTVALDLPSSSRQNWEHEMRMLALFDVITHRRLTYLVHGPSTIKRCLDLYSVVDSERVKVSTTRAVARPPRDGASFRERLATESQIADAAAAIVNRPLSTGPLGQPA